LDSSIPALVIGAILLLGASFLSRSSINSYDVLGQRVKEVEARTGEQARTRLTITGATLDAGNATLTVQVRNDGQTRVASWSAADVIVTYYTGPSTRENQWLAYATAAPAAGEWTVSSISPDSFEPGLLNPGETATLTIELGQPAAAGMSNVVEITTEAGVSVSAPFAS
jgi:archaellum component FlaF (FlaF/FlaG flagellin family)